MEVATNNALERLEINVDEKSGINTKEGFKSRVNLAYRLAQLYFE